MIQLISAGEPAPEFTAAGSDGPTYRLRSLLADSHVLLLFYPGNDTPG
ncbi:MAG: redoxin domain-containing protein [Gemmatimonadales bacterium]|nr:redoxin domain-containing protein [Gemmatimonadales bacterium]MBA3554468.1 redoxin domain-containing protein [Gemmatimonadales bacterium]